jgi:hypothetical protein
MSHITYRKVSTVSIHSYATSHNAHHKESWVRAVSIHAVQCNHVTIPCNIAHFTKSQESILSPSKAQGTSHKVMTSCCHYPCNEMWLHAMSQRVMTPCSLHPCNVTSHPSQESWLRAVSRHGKAMRPQKESWVRTLYIHAMWHHTHHKSHDSVQFPAMVKPCDHTKSRESALSPYMQCDLTHHHITKVHDSTVLSDSMQSHSTEVSWLWAVSNHAVQCDSTAWHNIKSHVSMLPPS